MKEFEKKYEVSFVANKQNHSCCIEGDEIPKGLTDKDVRYFLRSTNFTPDEIHGKYGIRLADRFNEMMERIVFTNGTYRV